MATFDLETGLLTIVCGKCKKTCKVQGWKMPDGEHWIFGSAADFCDHCGEMFGDEADVVSA